MASDLDKVLEELQKQMWEGYTETVIDHAQNPRNFGAIPNADGFASITSSCQDIVKIWLRVQNGTIRQASFWTDGCGATVATLSMVIELAKGKSIAKALKISQQDILDALGGLPEGNIHCASQAANLLKEAIKDYLAFRNEPWKRVYRQQS